MNKTVAKNRLALSESRLDNDGAFLLLWRGLCPSTPRFFEKNRVKLFMRAAAREK